MNNSRRARLRIALHIINEVSQEEVLSKDNLPDTLEAGEQGKDMEANRDGLREATLQINRVIER